MRKRTVNHLADTIFWYLIYFLPVLCYLLFMLVEPGTGSTQMAFLTFIDNIGFGIITDNIVISTLKQLFGIGGILPFFNTDMAFIIFGWFIFTFIIHLAVDFLLFIPRLAHKWMEKFSQGD